MDWVGSGHTKWINGQLWLTSQQHRHYRLPDLPARTAAAAEVAGLSLFTAPDSFQVPLNYIVFIYLFTHLFISPDGSHKQIGC